MSGLPTYWKHVANAFARIPLTQVRHPDPAECRVEPYYTSHLFRPPQKNRELWQKIDHTMVKSLFDFSGAAPRIYDASEIELWADALEGDKSTDTLLARFREEAPKQWPLLVKAVPPNLLIPVKESHLPGNDINHHLIGANFMYRMGWKGAGLGKHENGTHHPPPLLHFLCRRTGLPARCASLYKSLLMHHHPMPDSKHVRFASR